jgi:hypothetical protein
VPSTAVRVRFNCMSYQAGGIKFDGMLGNMRVYPLPTESLKVLVTLHDHDDNLAQTYSFTVTKTSQGAHHRVSTVSMKRSPRSLSLLLLADAFHTLAPGFLCRVPMEALPTHSCVFRPAVRSPILTRAGGLGGRDGRIAGHNGEHPTAAHAASGGRRPRPQSRWGAVHARSRQ